MYQGYFPAFKDQGTGSMQKAAKNPPMLFIFPMSVGLSQMKESHFNCRQSRVSPRIFESGSVIRQPVALLLILFGATMVLWLGNGSEDKVFVL